MESEALIERACQRAGATDFGADTWQEGLDVLLWSLDREAALNELGVSAMGDLIVRFLVNRLEVERCYAEHPEIDSQPVVAPLFGLGLPRTGSTALSFLLAQDPARRSLRTWEADRPCPPPETATEQTDARIAETQVGIDLTNAMFPDFVGLLPTSATGPQECLLLLGMDFRTQMFDGMARVPSYNAWLLSCDMEPGYQYHRRVLKLLQWHCPPTRWWLKSPSHMHSIDALDRVYPDAQFVMTHRAIGAVLPSVCALYQALSSLLTTAPDPAAIGRSNLDLWRISLERLIAFRDDGHERRFHDLHFAEVQHDPLLAVTRLYHELGDDLTTDARTRMEQWWADSAVHRTPSPRHEPSDFGLTTEQIEDQFRFANDRFGIAPEV